jgi:hypothetical protein
MTSRTPLRPRSTGWHRNTDRPCSRGRSCPRRRRQFRSAAGAPAMRHGCCDACEPVPLGLRARFRPAPLRRSAPAGAGKTLRRGTAGNTTQRSHSTSSERSSHVFQDGQPRRQPCRQWRPAGIVVINRVKPIFVTAEAHRVPRSSIRTQRFSAEEAASIDQFRQR